MTQSFLSVHWEKNWVILTEKVGSNFSSACDWTFRVKMTSILSLGALSEKNWVIWPKKLGRILISPVTQLVKSKWLNFFSRCTEGKILVILTEKIGSNFSSTTDSTFLIKMTQFFYRRTEKKIESFWPKKFLSQKFQSQIIVPPVSELLGSKWLNFFSRCTERKKGSFDLKSWIEF